MRQRVVEIEADLGEGSNPRWRYGSGLLSGDRFVLTAAHVVQAAVTVTVRGWDKHGWSAALDAALIGDPDLLDLALLDVPGIPEPLPYLVIARVNRDIGAGEFIDDCWAVGYPVFQEIKRDGRSRSTRVSAQFRGQIPLLAGLGDDLGLLSLQVTAPPREEKLGQSEWSGMSGAAVFTGDKLLGVIGEHALQRGPSDITLTPLDRLSDPVTAPTDAACWWARLGVSNPAFLLRLPTEPGRAEPSYQATLESIRGRTRVLLGRQDELSRIAAFATDRNQAFGPAAGPEDYLWLVGRAWAGKTALLAEAVFTMPASVDVVAYFLIARESQASQQQFLSAVVPQLAWLLDIDSPPAMDVHVFRALWAKASRQARISGRHLLLVVDGLDEDLRPDGMSVAALLPTEHLGQHARVLVASRPHPEVPDDVDEHHPLHTITTVSLAGSPYAAELMISAQKEIKLLLRMEQSQTPGNSLPFKVLGLLTAAAGALSVRDLATMTGVEAHVVRAFINRQAARSLEPVGAVQEDRYQFAHQKLLEYCQDHPDVGGDERYRDLLHGWAEDWRAKGWPTSDPSGAGTPRYLLDSYPAALAGQLGDPARPSDPRRLVNLVCDLRWVYAAVSLVGVAPVLTALRTAELLCEVDTRRVGELRRVLELQSGHLSSAHIDLGYFATQIAWEALRLGMDGLAKAARDRLRECSVRQLAPVWISERTQILLHGHNDLILVGATAITGDEHVVSGGLDEVVWLWNTSMPRDPGRVLGRHRGWVRAVAATRDGRVISGGSDGQVCLWDPAVPNDLGCVLGHHHGPVNAAAVSREGWVISGGDDGRVCLWDPAVPNDPGRVLGRHRSWVLALAVTCDGDVISGGLDGAVRLAMPGNPGRILSRHDGPVLAMAVNGHARLVVAYGQPEARRRVRLVDAYSQPEALMDVQVIATPGRSGALTLFQITSTLSDQVSFPVSAGLAPQGKRTR